MERFVGTLESALGGGAFVAVPAEVVAALGGGRVPVQATFDGLSYSRRREHVTAVTEAKRPDTRARRIAKVVAALS